MNPPSITISIPAFNEQESLEAVVRDSLSTLQRLTPDYEVLIIDDGSRDQTGELADRLAKENPYVRVLHHPKNMGFGVTLRDVFLQPRKEWVFFIPGDGQIAPQELDKLWPYHQTADVILGWRVERHDTLFRRVAAALYNRFISVVLRRRIHDVDSVVLFRRVILDGCTLSSNSAFIHAEFHLETARRGASMKEVPIDHRPRLQGQAKGFSWMLTWRTFVDFAGYFSRRV